MKLIKQKQLQNGRKHSASTPNGNHQCSVGDFADFYQQPQGVKSSATEWFQKLLNHKQEDGGTDLQTVTYFRKALRGEVLIWYNAVPLMDVDNLIWNNFITQFKQNFCATPIVSSVIQKLLETRQKDNETVIQYVSRCAEILLEL
jgi:hypothetical protein